MQDETRTQMHLANCTNPTRLAVKVHSSRNSRLALEADMRQRVVATEILVSEHLKESVVDIQFKEQRSLLHK